MTALRDNDVGISLARLNELQVHRLYSLGVSLNDPFHSLASFNDIPCHYTHQSVIIVSVDKNLDVQKLAKLRIRKYQDSFYDDDICRLHSYSLILRPSASDIGIYGLLDFLAVTKFLELRSKKIEIN